MLHDCCETHAFEYEDVITFYVVFTERFFFFKSCFPSQVVGADNNDVLTRNRPYPFSLPTPLSLPFIHHPKVGHRRPTARGCAVKTSISRPVVDVVGMVPVFFL